jgi:hypothetical protein
MLTCHELFGFMSPALAAEILDYAFTSDKDVYRATLKAVAEARKLRPVFFEKRPRVERHKEMLSLLTSPRLETVAETLLRAWLAKTQSPLLIEFLDSIGVAHEKGVVEDFPPTIDDAKLKAGVEALLQKHPPEKAAIYLHTLAKSPGSDWDNLKKLLEEDSRLHLG